MAAPDISAYDLFHDVEPKHLTELTALAATVKVPRGEFLVHESERGNEVYTILAGRVAITIQMPDRNDQETLAELRDGETFGESVLLGKQRRIASAVAQSDVTALRWEADRLDAYFRANPACGYVVMRNLAGIMLQRLTATNMMLRNTANRIVPII